MNNFKLMPRWQRAVMYAMLGTVLGYAVTNQKPQLKQFQSTPVLILVAAVGSGVAYKAGFTYGINNTPLIQEKNDELHANTTGSTKGRVGTILVDG